MGAPADLDPTFGDGGKVLTNVVRRAELHDVAMAPDGKIVAVGGTVLQNEDIHSSNPDRSFYAVVRYNPDGSLDSSFNGDGKWLQGFTLAGDGQAAVAVAIQSDGKVVFAGTGAPTRFPSIVVFRLNVDGTLDNSFNGNGYQIVQQTGALLFPTDIALQPDGKILVAGQKGKDALVVRLNPDGELDDSFDGDGMASANFGALSLAQALAIQPDGKIVIAGTLFLSSPGINHTDIAVARFNQNGSLDPSFEGDGKLTYDMGTSEFSAALAIQADGKIVVLGNGGFDFSLLMLRLNLDGSLDSSFDGDGVVQTPRKFATDAKIQPDGKIVVAGQTGPFEPFAAGRYNPDGSLDTSFGVNGFVTTSFSSEGIGLARRVVIQADGKIVVAGDLETGDKQQNIHADFALARYLGN
ncbi:MAG TPA: hypothetical protein VKD91_18065 [Pyrinomonadaceae bacterium]|nr:hypothetical protein [Pyrinomonadaceae bacterium]